MSTGFKKFRIPLTSRHSIEPEEIFFDSSKLKEFEESEVNAGKLERPISPLVFIGIVIFQIATLLFFGGYTAFLVFGQGESYALQSRLNSSRSLPVFAERGLIYSSTGDILAENEIYFDIFIAGASNSSGIIDEDILTLSHNIAGVLGMYWGDIYERFQTAQEMQFSEFALVKGLSRDEISGLKEYVVAAPFLEIRETLRRKFVNRPSLSHIIGYTNEVSQSDMTAKEYFPGERVGKIGIEAFYDEDLRGETGTLIKRINSNGLVLEDELKREPKAGKNITLHINFSLQEKIYDILSKHTKALDLDSAVVVVLDPRSGGVLSIVNIPTFDASLFEHGISKEKFDKLISDPSKPLFNRAISGEYPSGSTIKPLIAAAALEEEVVTSDFLVYSGGSINVPSVYNPEVIYEFKDWKIHGWADVRRAIADSVNIYFYTIGGGYGDKEGLGIQKIEEYLRKFGWGSSLEIDVPGESAGLIPSPKWKKETKGENWYIGDTYHVSIGQGDILATPLQVAAATAVFANKGTLFSPQVAVKIGEKEINPEVLNEDFISQKNLNIVREGMRMAVESGSSKFLSTIPVQVAGKTGTAQTGKERNHAWFTGFAPYENPEIVITVLLEEGGKSDYAVRVAKEIFEAYFALSTY